MAPKSPRPFSHKNAFFVNKLHCHKQKNDNFKPAPSAPAKTIELPLAMVEGSGYVVTLRWFEDESTVTLLWYLDLSSPVAPLRQLSAAYFQELFFGAIRLASPSGLRERNNTTKILYEELIFHDVALSDFLAPKPYDSQMRAAVFSSKLNVSII